ncbi:hypothetical protein ABZ883_40935 [Streptomyces sp. NPDC046977]|uniref:hypothetical protein n=1 Tax=Streptomyces sp. NPDC046977 TaxID=3154703 RepID=UPI0033C32333
MTMQSGPFSSVPLPALFPHAEAAEHLRMRRAAAALDGERPSGDEPTWEWFPQHITCPGADVRRGVPEILLTEISLYDKEADWLELALGIEWTVEGHLNVCAALSVACWCTENHNAHFIDERNLAIDRHTSLGSAFEAGVGRLIEWLAEPWDPEVWRFRSGLPLRWVS